MSIEGPPIPRLYAAGENGDIWTILYQCMSNAGAGCLVHGRIAGDAGLHAVRLGQRCGRREDWPPRSTPASARLPRSKSVGIEVAVVGKAARPGT